MNKDHAIAGSIGVALGTYLPPVLAYWQGAAAPVSAETGIIVTLLGAAYAGAVYFVQRKWPAPSTQAPAAPAAAAQDQPHA